MENARHCLAWSARPSSFTDRKGAVAVTAHGINESPVLSGPGKGPGQDVLVGERLFFPAINARGHDILVYALTMEV
jgi:hypothetical protein